MLVFVPRHAGEAARCCCEHMLVLTWHQLLARTPACLDFNTSMSWQQQAAHVLARTLACPGTSPACPGFNSSMGMLFLAQTPACLGVNTSMSWQQHQAASPACLGTSTNQHVLQHVLTTAPANTSMSWQQHQAASPAVLARTPACHSVKRRPPQHVLTRTPECLGDTPACLGNSTRRPP